MFHLELGVFWKVNFKYLYWNYSVHSCCACCANSWYCSILNSVKPVVLSATTCTCNVVGAKWPCLSLQRCFDSRHWKQLDRIHLGLKLDATFLHDCDSNSRHWPAISYMVFDACMKQVLLAVARSVHAVSSCRQFMPLALDQCHARVALNINVALTVIDTFPAFPRNSFWTSCFLPLAENELR